MDYRREVKENMKREKKGNHIEYCYYSSVLTWPSGEPTVMVFGTAVVVLGVISYISLSVWQQNILFKSLSTRCKETDLNLSVWFNITVQWNP